jgi:hypothetical protein
MNYYYKYLKYKKKYLNHRNINMIGGVLPDYEKIKIIYNDEKKKSNDENAKLMVIQEFNRILNTVKEKPELKKNFLNLRILLDNQFMKDINCKYNYLITPKKYGCDLLELTYNILSNDINKELELRNSILSGIASCALEKSSIPHILTDIDDTLYANPGIFGINIAGSDYSWKKKELYPGLEEFYKYFTKFTQDKHIGVIIYKTILSATPTSLKNHKLHDNNLKKALGDNFSFLSGKDSKIDAIKDIHEKGEYLVEPNAESVAATKFDKFQKYRSLFPEYKLLFIGDNGQGDLIAGEKMLNVDKDCMVFIHNIIKKDGNFKFDDEKIKEYTTKDINKDRLFFFKNYFELSQIFKQKNLLDETHVNLIKDSISSKLRVNHSISNEIINKNYHCCKGESCSLGCIKKN